MEQHGAVYMVFCGDFQVELLPHAGMVTGSRAVGRLSSAKRVERVELLCDLCQRLQLCALNTWPDGSGSCPQTRAVQGDQRASGSQIDYLLVSGVRPGRVIRSDHFAV